MPDSERPATRQPAAVPARLLVAYAHPDDESFGPAALLAKCARSGTKVFGVFATRGEHGQTVPGAPSSPEALGEARTADLLSAAARIGFARLDFLDYEDGTLDQVPQPELQGQYLAALRQVRPEVVITFGPAGMTGHPDHMAVHRAVHAAFHQVRAIGAPELRELYYDAVGPEMAAELQLGDAPDGQPNTWIDVAETRQVKLDALRAHARHVADAQDMLRQLDRRPEYAVTLHRAWPPVPAGRQLTALMEPPASPEL